MAHWGRCGRCKGDLAPLDEPLAVAAEDFDDITQNAVVPVLVDFWAEWCGPCRTVAPAVKKVARELAGRAIVLKVDTEAHPDVARRFRVQSIPMFVVFARGQPVIQQAGAVDHQTLRRWIESAR